MSNDKPLPSSGPDDGVGRPSPTGGVTGPDHVQPSQGIGEADYTEQGYPPHVNATATTTPPPDIPQVVLAETGGVDITGPLAFFGTLVVILGAAAVGHAHRQRKIKKGSRQ